MSNTDDILRKIAALMAKANGTENEHEAAAFAAKAQAMLADHNMSMEDVVKYGAAKVGDRVAETTLDNKYATGWRVTLMGAVCRFYFCKLLLSQYYDTSARGNGIKRKRFLVIGQPHNAAVAMAMFPYLERTTIRLGREWMRAHGGSRSEQLRFEAACGLRLCQRLDALRAEQMRPAPVVPGKVNLPALYNQEAAAITAFMESKYAGDLRQTKSRALNTDGRGGMAGRAAAEGIGLNTQVGQSRPNALLG